MKTIIWVLGVSIVAIGVFIFLVLGDAQKTVPKIKLSYFVDETEIAESVTKRLQQEIEKTSTFWIGIEPEKPEQLEVVLQLKNELEKTKKLSRIIADEELNLSKEWIDKLKVTDSVTVKSNMDTTGEILSKLEKSGESYLLITAAIYSNSVIIENQIHQLRQKYQITPITFSLAYFPVTADDEGNMLFPCRAEDHAGTAAWGCAVANKARFTRRKINPAIEKKWVGMMDLTGEKDYMILLKKKK